MTSGQVSEAQWARLADFVAQSTGLHFPQGRRDDLQRGVAEAAQELGFADVAAYAGWLLAAPPSGSQLQVLASHLTIGETYFFRDPEILGAFASDILPGLIRSRRGHEQRLRIWSAGCCSGEEAYSLAILVHEALPDLSDWHVTITATDINPRFLHKAEVGCYGEWSFRNAPAALKERYFKRTSEGRYAIAPQIRRLVSFSPLNLAQDADPSLASGTDAMDIIFCRNVLMYFTPQQACTVIGNLHRALVEGGWLAVSPSETSQALYSQFATVNFPGAILYRKDKAAAASASPARPMKPMDVPTWTPPLPFAHAEHAAALQTPPTPTDVAEQLYKAGHYADAAEVLAPALTGGVHDPIGLSLMARALANLGRLDEAMAWCDRWIAADKLNPGSHYLRAVVLLERGEPGPARESLQRAIYLEPGLVLAHFALGNVARGRGKAEADRHFGNALQMLGGYAPDDVLPDSDGLTAGRLAETVRSMMEAEVLP